MITVVNPLSEANSRQLTHLPGQNHKHAFEVNPMIEIYVSTDVETDGPVAGKHSMLSLGSAAFTADKRLLSTFSANLETLPEFSADATTTAWWATQPAAWKACRQQLEHPVVAMCRYLTWLQQLPGRPVFVAYPAAFDFPFVYWYLTQYAGENPFGYAVIDIKTYAMAMLHQPYRTCGKASMPAEWIDPVEHTHIALDDAIEQGSLFCNMLQANLRGPKYESPEPGG
jgi:DNA polymerase III alpha subunit (gram-positive type)